MVIDKPVLGIVTNRKDVFILYLADGTLDDVSEQFNTKPEINLNETLRPSKSWSHRLKLISVSPWTAKIMFYNKNSSNYVSLTFAQALVEELVVVWAPWVLEVVLAPLAWEHAEA